MRIAGTTKKGTTGRFVLLALPLIATWLVSCEKVVSIDLNQADPHTVIEGVVTDGNGPYKVTLTKTGDYFVPSLTFSTVTHAFVKISDNLGEADTLKEITSGTYISSRLQGIPGRTYSLQVIAEGKDYEGTSTMPRRVDIDTLFTTPLREADGDRGYNIYIAFKDPPEPGNYYRIDAHTNVEPTDSLTGRRFILFDDKLSNGNESVYRIRAARNINPGDTLTVQLFAIDYATYEYFKTVDAILTSDRSPTSLAPANPNTNLSNGSLGYFAAYTVDKKVVVLR